MKVATVDGLVTLFYDRSEELYNYELDVEWWQACEFRRLNVRGLFKEDDIESSLNISDECKRYLKKRLSWQQVIVVDCVTEIPYSTFHRCLNIRRVIFADTVIRIEDWAFCHCKNLSFIKWSLSLEYIGECAFGTCNLSSIFIPPRCRQIGGRAFAWNKNLTILNFPCNTKLEQDVICYTKLLEKCPNNSSINRWLKNINNHENLALHRVCSSFEPTLQMIVDTMKEKGGLKATEKEII